MQLLPRYLCNNTTTLIADVAGTITEYRPVYSKQLQLYKGIDNVLEFRLLNADQKPVDITTYTPKLIAFDENNLMVIEKDCFLLLVVHELSELGLGLGIESGSSW